MTNLTSEETVALICFVLLMVFCFAVIVFMITLIIHGFRCKHTNIKTRTFWVTTACEQTADFCIDCGKQVSKLKHTADETY